MDGYESDLSSQGSSIDEAYVQRIHDRQGIKKFYTPPFAGLFPVKGTKSVPFVCVSISLSVSLCSHSQTICCTEERSEMQRHIHT